MKVEIPQARIEEFCRKWHIAELALFGSVLRDDFRDDSDIDVLVTFEPGARVSLFGFVEAQEELATLLGKAVDLVEKAALRNPFVREHALANHRVIYAA